MDTDGHFHDFLADIEAKEFDMATCSGDHIAKKIIEFKHSGQHINVKYYKSPNPWSKAYGYYTKSRPFDVNINIRKMNRSTSSFVATLVHEMIHAIDGLDMIHDFGHGSNSSDSKDDTAPYWIGTLASKYYGDEQIPEDYPRVVRTPWYKKVWRWLF